VCNRREGKSGQMLGPWVGPRVATCKKERGEEVRSQESRRCDCTKARERGWGGRTNLRPSPENVTNAQSRGGARNRAEWTWRSGGVGESFTRVQGRGGKRGKGRRAGGGNK